VVVDHNLFFGNLSGNYNFTAGNSDYSYTLGTIFSTDPLFVSGTSAAFDPHLTASSPAIKNGVNLFSVFKTDTDGTLRSSTGAWDLGGYSYGSATSQNPGASGIGLRMSVQNGALQLRGPTNHGVYVLQSKGITSSTWQDVTLPPVVDNAENLVNLSISGPGMIFRLRSLQN